MMRSFQFVADAQRVFDIVEETIRNPGPRYSGRNVPECLNKNEVMGQCKKFVKNAIQYGWYRFLTEEEKGIPEDLFVFSQIDLLQEIGGSEGYMTVFLALNPQFLIVTEVNSMFCRSTKSKAIVCRRRDQPVTSSVPGLVEVNFPLSLRSATGDWHKIFGIPGQWYIHEKIITYSLARLKIPKVETDDLPLYLNTNPVLEESLNIEEGIKSL